MPSVALFHPEPTRATSSTLSRIVLETGQPYSPDVVTFWGVGFAVSDVDLLRYYRKAMRFAKRFEFINPSMEAVTSASRSLHTQFVHFASLDAWIHATAILVGR